MLYFFIAAFLNLNKSWFALRLRMFLCGEAGARGQTDQLTGKTETQDPQPGDQL